MKSNFLKVSVALFIVIALSLTLTITSPLKALAFDGSGTAESPYLIASCDDLNDISASPETLAAHYRLSDSINCASTSTANGNETEWQGGVVGGTLIPDEYTGVINNGYSGFDPIGDPMAPFTGVFDGNGKTISNLWIFRKDTTNVGLFAYTQNASITNLTLTGSSVVGGFNTGGLVGMAENTAIQGVTVQGSMTRAYLNYRGGGIVGEMYHNLENDSPAYIIDSVVINGNVHGSGNIIGGLVGYMNGGAISGSSSSADIDGGYAIGGVVGEMSSGTISNTTVGDVLVHADYAEGGLAKYGDKTGGFVGSMTGGAIYNSTTAATVEAEGSEVGGFVGSVRDYDIENQTIINGSYATGAVTGLGNGNDNSGFGSQNSNSVGGFAGYASGEGVAIMNSYSSGNVAIVDVPLLSDSYGVGGFIGAGGCAASVSQSYATGSVSAGSASNVGGFVGDDGCEGPGGNYERVYASGSVEGLENVGGLFGNASNTNISKSYATGMVAGNVNVGGLVGHYTSGDRLVSQSYALGLVTALDQTAGGIFGYFAGRAEDVYARGNVSGPLNVGGFAGEVDGSWIIRRAYATGVLTANPGSPQGFIGEDNASSDVVAEGLYYDQQTTGVSSDGYATAKDTNQLKLIVNQSTFAGYDFEGIWEFNVGQNDDYPLFQWQLDPIGQILCEAASMTATTGRISCAVQYSGGNESRAEPESWMNPQYRIAGDTEWTSMEWTASSEGRHTFYGLTPGTTYEFSMTVANNIINQALISVGTTLAADSDVDADGVIDMTENAGPNSGDANNDGTLDAEQNNVTSQNNFITDKQFVLQSTCGSNYNSQIGRESDEGKDIGYDYPAGLAAFVLQNCGANGSTATVTLYYFGDYDVSKFVLRKSNSAAGQYTTISGAALSNVTIGGQPALKVVYQITDGGPLDQDGIADGNIVDPVGIALSTLGVPNTGLGRRK